MPSPPWEAEERYGYAGTLQTCGGLGGPVRGPIATVGGRGASRLRRGAPNVRGAWGARSRPHRHRGRQRSVTATPGRSERAGGLGGPFEAPSPPWEAEERHGYAGALRTCGGLGGPVRGPIATVG